MDLSRLKRVLAGVSATAISLTSVSGAFAAYSDVSAGVWYEDAVNAFTDAGYLDQTQPRFRGGDTANRAEFVKLLVELNGGILSTPPAVPSFDDVSTSAWYFGYMEEAGKEQWVRGDGDCYGKHPCYARPGANINRAEAASLIVRAFGLESTAEAPDFVDNPSGQWYTEAIQTAADHCVLQGDDSTGRVRPADNMNRAEMVVMLFRVDQGLSYGVDCGTETGPVDPALISATAVSSTKVELDFNVSLDETTAEMVSKYSVGTPTVAVTNATLTSDDKVELTLASSLTAGKEYTVTATGLETADGETFSDSATFNGYSALPQGDGELEVSVSAKNPVGDSVPKGAHGVTLLSLDLAASCKDSVILETLTVLHEGFGDKADIDGVYATVDGGRVTRERSIDSKDQTADLRFTSPMTIDACKTVTLDIVADFSSTAQTSAEHNFAVELASDLQGNAKAVTGDFPLKGETFRVAAVTAGTLTIAYRSVTPSEVDIGDKGKVLGKFEVSANSVEDQTLYSVTLENDGSASDGDFTNLKIRRTDGTVLTNTVAQTKNGFATFVFNPPFTVLEGDKIVLEVVGDIVGGAAETVKLHVDETGDVFSVGSLYGYGVNGQLYGSTVSLPTTDNSSEVDIQAGEFTIEIDGPAQQTYTRDQNDAILANVEFKTGGETIDIKEMYALILAQTSTGAAISISGQSTADSVAEVLENVTLRNSATGRSIEGVRLTGSSDFGNASATGSYQVYRFDDFTVSGNETFQIKVDFIDNGTGVHPKNGDQFKVLICGEPTETSAGANATGCRFNGIYTTTAGVAYQMEIEGLSSGDNVTDVRPGGTIVGSTHRIADSNLTVTVQSLATTVTSVKNAKNVNLLRFEARAGEAKSILLTKLTFDAESGSLNNGTNYALWVDTDADGKVDTVLDSGVSSQSNAITFDDLTGGGFVLDKEETTLFEVHSDIAGALTNTDLMLKFATGSTSYIEAETVDRGTSLSGIKTNSAACGSTTCEITVLTKRSTNFSLVNQGDLFVSKDTTTLRNRQLLGGALGEAILRLNLKAQNEPIDVTNLHFTSSGGTATAISRLELYKDGATTPFQTATECPSTESVQNTWQGTTVRSFCAKMQSQQLVVPKDGEVKILVRPLMKADTDGATSGQVVQLFIDPTRVANNTTGSGAVRARGVDSSNDLNANDADASNEGEIFIGTTSVATNAIISGARNDTVLSKITSITNASPDANGTSVPTGIANIGQFKIAAAQHSNDRGANKVTLSGVTFNVSAQNVAIEYNTMVLYNKADSTITASCTPTTLAGTAIITSASGSFLVKCNNLIAGSSVNTAIDRGTDQTFALRANVTNPKVLSTATSTLQVSLTNFNDISKSTYGPTTSHFNWFDLGTGPDSSSSEFMWVEYPETNVNSTSYNS